MTIGISNDIDNNNDCDICSGNDNGTYIGMDIDNGNTNDNDIGIWYL